MYLYLYDSFLNHKKYSNLLAKIETRLTDLGIGGKIFRLSPLRNINDLLNDEVKNGVKTIVAVGNDKTLTQIVNAAAKFDVTIGIIPIGEDNKIAKIFGIISPEQACNALASRITERIDLGLVNNTYFISNLSITSGELTIECENKYQIIPQVEDQINICNLRPLFATGFNQNNYFNPQDSFLEILIQPLATKTFGLFKRPASQKTIIPIKKMVVKGKNSVSIITDGQKILKTPVKIDIVPQKLKVIVGKDRLF